ncbi:MAG: phosphoadenosine phosphosulfate reductase family protein [Gomphosphaeria aponina SAG 52.96 = DSM 107014]|uniref:Phosphoadenosine phosphosulfate reductase family protein n=1 Tax=Gomphosphaeria aponina SAG 52.96 = DSM 107014 TaxID=1521640 RepID=A0A941GQK3_9CHRO|nr:phosphoadenosine phosphosulfate reductase family protein [Gomphosphaeria aponina SAG 52.96 = DSM 107014]
MTTLTLSPIKTAKLDLERIEQQFRGAEPKKILAWCVENMPTGLVFHSTFSIDDLVITDILYRVMEVENRIPVIFIDTLHHFPETLALVETAKKIYNLDLRVYKVEGLAQKDVLNFTKTELLQELNAQAWITGNCRNNEQVFSPDEKGRLQINPLAYWRRVESWAYAYEYDLIYNPLYDEGYSEIGPQLSI